MPRRRGSPLKNIQTGYYFFDSYDGLPPMANCKRLCTLAVNKLSTKKLGCFIWEKGNSKEPASLSPSRGTRFIVALG